MSTESWYTTRNTSTWFEATDAHAWIPAQQNAPNTKSNAPVNMKNLKTGKSDSSDRGLKEQKLEHRAVTNPQSDLSSKFFELPANTVSDQNAWNAYVLSNASADGWDTPNDKTPVPEKAVVFSKLKRNIDIENELTKQNLYKTELCQSWMETGICRYGTKCQFAHGKDEQRPVIRHPKYKTEVCKTFSTTGQCPYGKRCRFVHQDFEGPDDEDNSTDEAMLRRKLQEISLSLSPDPVFSEENSDPVISPNNVKKGSRLPFLQKLRKQL
jgi:hypothetical protein